MKLLRVALLTLVLVALQVRPLHATGWAQILEPEIEALRKGDVAAAQRNFSGEKNKDIPETIIVEELLPAALESGSVQLLQYLKTREWLAACKRTKGCEPIARAASSGSVPLIRYLMNEGFSIQFWNQYGQSALHLAAKAGKLAATQFFCEQHLDALARTKDNGTALDQAILGWRSISVPQIEFKEREAVVDYLRGRTCRVGDPYPVLASLPPSCSVALDGSRRVTRIFSGAPSEYRASVFCVVLNGGSPQCWRGEDSPIKVASPFPDYGNLKFEQLALSNGHRCVLTASKKVKCWGSNDNGELGLGDTKRRFATRSAELEAIPFVDLGPEVTARQIAARFRSTCVLTEDGVIKCWGRGELGSGNSRPRGSKPGEMGANLPAVDLGAGMKADQLAGRCALLRDSSVKCWGDNRFGQLGLGDSRDRGDNPGEMGDHLSAVDLGSSGKVKQITASQNHNCALFDNGQVKCWGANYYGQLGLGDARTRGDDPNEMGDKLPFVNLGRGLKAVQIVADRDETCALLDNGGVKCWGFKGRGYFPAEMGDNLPYVKFQ